MWFKDILQKVMRILNSIYENDNEMRDELSSIGQKVDLHVVTIKHLEL